MSKKIEKDAQQGPQEAPKPPTVTPPSVVYPVLPGDRIENAKPWSAVPSSTPKITRTVLKALIHSEDPDIVKDPRLLAAVDGIPEYRIGLFARAMRHLHEDVTVYLDYLDKLHFGTLDPKAAISKYVDRKRPFSFCVHPLTGMVLIHGVEKGHEEMMNENGVPPEMYSRFSVGATLAGNTQMKVSKPAIGIGLADDETSVLSHKILSEVFAEAGCNPETLRLVTPKKPSVGVKLITRGYTPNGVAIPLWNVSTGNISDLLAQRRELLRAVQTAAHNREADDLFASVGKLDEKIKALESGSQDPLKSVVFEGGYCYTSISLPSIRDAHGSGAYNGLNHDRTVVAIINAAGNQASDVFNNVDGDMGVFVPTGFDTLHDGRNMKTTNGNASTGGGELIIRVKSRQGEVPILFERISKLFASGIFMKTD